MTKDGVRSGGSPRARRPDDSDEFQAPPNAPRAAPGAGPGSAAPKAAPPPPDDWLAPRPPARPVAPASTPPPAAPAPAVPAPISPYARPVAPAVGPAVPNLAPAVTPVVAPRTAPPIGRFTAPTYADDTLTEEPFDDELDEDELDEDGFEDDDVEGDELEEAERAKLPLSERLKRTPPALVILTLAAVGSTGFLAMELAARTTPIAVLSSAAAVVGFCYSAIAVVCGVSTYRVSLEGRTRLAFLLAFIGGSAAIVAAASFAGGLLLVLALGI